MSEEKVLHEVKVTETEDGFRIEIKGDKERLKELGFGPGMRFGHFGFGPFGHGPFSHGPMHHMRHRMRARARRLRHMYRHGPEWGSWWEGWYEDAPAPEDRPTSGPEADF